MQLTPLVSDDLSEREFFSTQSRYSDPGKYAYLLDPLPTTYADVSRVVQGLIYHYMAGQYIYGYCPPKERMDEIDTRVMERMLGRIMEMDNRPLNESRSFENRFVGCCRDFSLLTCAILRQHGIPARSRYGFASYFLEGYWMDHVIVEAWNGERWQRFDPQVTNGVDKLDLSDAEYVTGGRAWQMIRSEGADASKFGLGPEMPELSGPPMVMTRLMVDAAALNKQELLCWDLWGLGNATDKPLSAADEALLDKAAVLSAQSDAAAIQALLATENKLHVSPTVTCHSPAVGPHEVAV